jgi:hypothetical protein
MAEMSLLRRRMIEDMTIDLTLRDRRSHPRVAALALPRLQVADSSSPKRSRSASRFSKIIEFRSDGDDTTANAARL